MQKWIDGEPTEVKAKSAVGQIRAISFLKASSRRDPPLRKR